MASASKVKRRPSRKQLAARRKFIAMVRLRARNSVHAFKKRATTARRSRKSRVNRIGATKRRIDTTMRKQRSRRSYFGRARRSYRRHSSGARIDLMALGVTAFADPIMDSFINRYVPNVLGSVDATQPVFPAREKACETGSRRHTFEEIHEYCGGGGRSRRERYAHGSPDHDRKRYCRVLE